MWEDFGILAIALAREFRMFWSLFISQDKDKDGEVHEYDNSKI